MPGHLPTRLLTVAAMSVAGVAPLAGVAAATSTGDAAYTYTIIADTDDGFEPFQTGCPAVNNAGEVAFRAQRTSGEQQVLLGSGGELTIIADNEAEGLEFFEREVAINDRGDVAFAVDLPSSGEAVLRGNGTTLKTMATTAGAPYAFFAPEVSVDGKGRVFYKAILDNGDNGLFSAKQPSKQKTHFLASQTEFDGDSSDTSIRGSKIAFTESTDDDTFGAYVLDGTKITPIVDDTGGYNFVDNPSIGPRGRVALHATLDFFGEAIIVGRGGAVQTVADTTGPFGAFGQETPSQNGKGKIVFTATLDDRADYGLYDGPDPVANKIIAPVDSLAGSQVLQVITCEQALNDKGQIAFMARLGDGREVVVRADPVA